MKIDHVALWTDRLEEMKDFYVRHFQGVAGLRYTNPAKGFSSYFVQFQSGARLELMTQESGLPGKADRHGIGYAHMAIAVGCEAAVRRKTEELRAAQVPVVGEARWTGDGCFESVVSDPDGNRLEITI